MLVLLILLVMQNLSSALKSGDPDLLSEAAFGISQNAGGLNDDHHFGKAWLAGKQLVKEVEKLEERLFEIGILPHLGSPSDRLQNFLKQHLPLKNVTHCAIIAEHVKRSLGNCVDFTRLPHFCQSPEPRDCDVDYLYRSFNGSCNNFQNPSWGMSQTAFARLLKPDYADGVSMPRASAFGGRLPNARVLSATLYAHKGLPDAKTTLLFMNFGLFIDHDIIQIAAQNGRGGTVISCCDPRVMQEPYLHHPECLEIDVSPFDNFYGPLNVTCIDFVRSRPVCGKCAGQREQLNLATSYLDGSAVYGASDDRNRDLRTFHHGLLSGCTVNDTSVLPVEGSKGYACGAPKAPVPCFLSGDSRVNENVDLTSVHNLWFREHNRVATALGSSHPEWNDERIFQEARRIVVAEIQHITYNEFLPILLGDEAMDKYGLVIRNGLYEIYDDGQDGSIYNVFAAAAYRFGHSLIQGLLDLYDEDNLLKRRIPLHETFLNPRLIFQGSFDFVLRGMLLQKSHAVGSYITPEVRNRLFQPLGGNFGLDLSAYGIQRGRDHGIPGYLAWRKYCELPQVHRWEDLYAFMDTGHVEKMRQLYICMDDIDLTPAALAEHHVRGSMLGPTLLCLLGKQFRKLRVADRFWFETANQSWSFTKSQLYELYNSSMARIICDNSDDIRTVQRLSFLTPSDENPILSCEDLPYLDLSKWK